jgi:hypothetical protein
MKKLLIASLVAGISLSSQALATVTMASGVTLEPKLIGDLDKAQGNFNNNFSFIQWWDDSSTATAYDSLNTFNPLDAANWSLNGIGKMDITGDLGTLNCNACEITFEFGGLGVNFIFNDALLGNNSFLRDVDDSGLDQTSADFQTEFLTYFNNENNTTYTTFNELTEGEYSLPASIPEILISDTSGESFLNVYVDHTPDAGSFLDFTINDGTLTNDEMATVVDANDLWLTLDFNEGNYAPEGSEFFGLAQGDTDFSFTVTGGPAEDNIKKGVIRETSLDLNAFSDLVGLSLGASFLNGSDADLFATGTAGTITGVAVAEPSSIAVLGAGLIMVFGAARRRK